ncbi:glycosyltransferase BC10-like [Silene latifolia]|uniref:glycosyltransferase BC10-like n=1 Tax=Silene latifolia TaxID=37657 RepID=UPI003D783069
MQTKVNSLEEGKDGIFVIKTRGLPLKLLLILSMLLVICAVFSFISANTFTHFGLDTALAVIKPNYEPCIGATNSLVDWIRPPSSNLMHNLTDEQLFWRATLVPRINKYPFPRKPKIAFMFLTKGPLPLAPLWERFFKGNEGRFSIYIHSMPGYTEDFSSTSVFYRRNVPSKLAEWGQMSMCDAERRLLANALLDFSNEWFMLVSESCIPLYNFTVIYDYISKSKYSFMGSIDELGPDGRGRYNENMAPEVNLTQWRKSSQWFEINRRLAINVVEDTFFYPKFKEFCKPNCYVDEHYFPTMLTMRSAHLLANRSITLVDWSRGGAHPATFGSGDITIEFFEKILRGPTCKYNDGDSSMCFIFARKFAPSTLEPLLQLSPTVLGF